MSEKSSDLCLTFMWFSFFSGVVVSAPGQEIIYSFSWGALSPDHVSRKGLLCSGDYLLSGVVNPCPKLHHLGNSVYGGVGSYPTAASML